MNRRLPNRSRVFLALLLFLLLVPACSNDPADESDVNATPERQRSGSASDVREEAPSATEINAAAAGQDAVFVHRATPENIESESTYLDSSLTNENPEARILITRNWNPGGRGGTYDDHPVGVWYDTDAEQWAIYNEDRKPMPEDAAFNVAVLPNSEGIVHRSTGANTSANSTYLNLPQANGNPDAMVMVTRSRSGDDEPYNDHPVGVWYDSEAKRWAIYNEDRKPMPEDAAFNVAVSDRELGVGQAFVHKATSESANGNSTYLDSSLTNENPEARILITRNWNPGGRGGTYDDHPVGVWYDTDAEQWAIYNEDRKPMPEDAAFNVAVSNTEPGAAGDIAGSGTDDDANGGETASAKQEKPRDETQTDDLPEGIPEYRDFYAEGDSKPPTDLVSGNSSVGAIPPVKPFNFGRDPGGPEDKTLYLTIPELEIQDIPVFDTLSEERLRDGAVHIPATGYPWQDGANVFIAGHRIGFPNTLSYYIFFNLDNLEKGDEIQLRDSGGREFIYRVTTHEVVGPENVGVMNAVEGRSLISLQTCTLPDYKDRLIVRGELVEKNT